MTAAFTVNSLSLGEQTVKFLRPETDIIYKPSLGRATLSILGALIWLPGESEAPSW